MSDTSTLALTVEGGVSYLPIPTGAGQNFPGLLTLELPLASAPGMSSRFLCGGSRPRLEGRLVPKDAEREIVTAWRYVVGSFVVRVPVSTGQGMLVPEQITLAIMKWRRAHPSPGNRWAPVLQRYVEYLSARLDGIGRDASEVPPSLTWVPDLPGGKRHGGGPTRSRERELCGKVVEVLFDCYGEFQGFVLEGCCDGRPPRGERPTPGG